MAYVFDGATAGLGRAGRQHRYERKIKKPQFNK